ncbi:MAG TPA: hypothetical protein VFT69_11575 [Pseudolabrys sp.]|nr:hypothetical protein [Pseudolabrys sp.]
MADLGHLFVAAIGLGAGGEAIRRYRAFKQRRRGIPYAERNAGFWTDKRLYLSEAAFSALVAALPFTAIILAVATNNNLWFVYLAIVAYAFFIFLMMRALNMREPQ